MYNNKNNYKKILLIIAFLIIIIILCIKCCANQKDYVTFKSYNNYSEKFTISNGKIEKPKDPKREGYVFAGWYYNDKLFDFNTKVTEDIILVAKWEKIVDDTYKITFNSNGGNSVDDQNVKKNNKVIKPNDPIRKGYTFIGWYYNDNIFNFDTKINSDIILNAKWENTQFIDFTSTQASIINTTKNKKNNTNSNTNSDNAYNPTVVDITKPEIVSVDLEKTSNKIIASVVAKDDKTSIQNLKIEYSIDGIHYQTSNLFNGLNQDTTYKVYIKVTDESSNVEIKNKEIKTDKLESPVIESITPTTITNSAVEIKIKESNNNFIQYSLDGITFINYTDKIIVNTNGLIKFRLYDGKNYSDVESKEITNIDKTKPDDFAPTITKTTKKITIIGTTHDNVTSDINLVYTYSLDGTTYQTSNIFDNLNNTLTYTVYVKVLDTAGNERIVTVSDITLEDVPTPIIILDKTNLTNTNVVATVSNVGSYTLQCKKFDEVDYSECTSPVTITNNTTMDFRLYDGKNYSDVESKEITNIDKTLPQISFSPNGSIVYEKSQSTVVTTSDTNGIDINYYAWSDQNVVAPTFTSTFSSGDTLTNNTNTGNTFLWIKTINSLGTVNTQVSSAFALDNTDPEITIIDTSESTNKISINLVGTDYDSEIDGYYYSISENSTDNYSSKQTSGVYVFTGLKNATTYYLKVKAVDNAGNEKISNTLTITTADLGTITISVDNERWSTSKTLTVSNDQINGEHYYYKISGDADWTEITTNTFQKIFTENTSIEFKTSDGVNTEISSFDIEHIDRIKPTINSIQWDDTKITSTTITINLSSQDNGDSSEKSDIKGYSFSTDNGVTWSAIENVDSHILTNLTPLTEYTIKVKVYDHAGNYAESSINAFTANGDFIFDSTTGTIKGINNFTPGKMVIPSTIDGVTVKKIGGKAFANKNITSLVISNTVESIDGGAFGGNNISGTLIIPDSVTTIGADAFRNDATTDPTIDNLIIGSGITFIGRTAFHDKIIKNIKIVGAPVIDYGAFKKTMVETLDLGGTTSIGGEAFGANNLHGDLTIPSSVTTIGASSFRNDTVTTAQINTLTIPASVTTIGDTAFHAMAIKELILEGAPTVGKGIFKKCGLEKITLVKLTSMTSSEMFGFNNLTSVTIPNTVTTISNNVFSGNPTLTEIIIDKEEGSLPYSPWGASSATITYLR